MKAATAPPSCGWGNSERVYFRLVLDEERGRGTFPPAWRASESPIAIACSRLVTFFPERPDLSSPRFISCIARSTFSPALGPYRRAAPLFLGIVQLLSSMEFARIKPRNLFRCTRGCCCLTRVCPKTGAGRSGGRQQTLEEILGRATNLIMSRGSSKPHRSSPGPRLEDWSEGALRRQRASAARVGRDRA